MRFSPIQVFDAHLQGLCKRSYREGEVTSRPDIPARLTLYLVPLVPVALSIWKKFQLENASTFLSGVALIVGALLAVYVQLATSRQKFQRNDTYRTPERDNIDEAVAHILFGVYVALALLVSLTLFEVVHNDRDWLSLGLSSLSVYLGGLLLLVFLLIVPKLWNVYDQENEVPRRMGGTGD